MSNGRINARSAIENITQVTGSAETVVLEDIARRLDKASPAPSVFHQDTGAEITPNILKQFFQAIALGDVVILNAGENGPTKTCHDWDMPTDKGEPPIGEFEFYPADLLTLLKFENGLIRPYLAENIEQLDRQWRYGNRTPKKSTQSCEPQAVPAPEVEAVTVEQSEPVPRTNKLRRNNLDPAIDKAIKQAGNMKLADVYLKLKALAMDEEQPFTGALEKDALCYTDDNNQPAKLTKGALGQRLKRRLPPLADGSRRA